LISKDCHIVATVILLSTNRRRPCYLSQCFHTPPLHTRCAGKHKAD